MEYNIFTGKKLDSNQALSIFGGNVMASVSLKNVYKRFEGGVVAVSDFSIDIADKEFIILVGPSGCGKSTTLRMIAGLEEITEGEIYIGEKLVNDVQPKDRDIAMVFQNYALYPHMTVYDNMAFGLKLRKVPKADIKRRVTEAAKILEIEHLLDRKPKALSGGQRQRVALGRAIVRDPKVFLMDEPLSNLDAKLRVQMRVEITKLHQRLNTTIIYVTHDQTEAMTMGTRIVVMKDGFIQQIDDPTNLYLHPSNIFVAGFIGMPPMNFVNATVIFKNEQAALTFNNIELLLPAKYNNDEVKSYDGKEVIAGIRPEALTDEVRFVAANPRTSFPAHVDVVEMLGAETYLYVTVAGIMTMTARVDPTVSHSKVGEVSSLAVDGNRVHLFDKDTEQVIHS
jgi:multiple sugar transport system ATP-binding protein